MKKNLYFLVIVLIVVVMFSGPALSATKKPMTLSELALYKGADRQQILEEGAKKEGNLTFYSSGMVKASLRPIVNAFEKKYPYIKVKIWRAGTNSIVPRILEENNSRKYIFDVLETSQMAYFILGPRKGVFHPYYSPNLAHIDEAAISKSPSGDVLRAGIRVSGHSLGYNTKLITKDQLPKSFEDLLDPKWKGKVAISGDSNGVYWLGTMLNTYGEDFLKRIAEQNFDVHMVSARTLLDMIIAGEYVCAPNITESHAIGSKRMGAPVEWIPLDPVHVNVGQVGLSMHSPNPHAAILFVDHELSREVGEIYKAGGYGSTRKDVIVEKPYKRHYGPYSLAEAKKWSKLFDRLFMNK
ncbi:ABC transporter substrate-binding protein [Thermodesulfobacteriota bacterium]